MPDAAWYQWQIVPALLRLADHREADLMLLSRWSMRCCVCYGRTGRDDMAWLLRRLPRRRRPEARDGPGATCLAVDMSRRWSAEPGSFAILRPPMPRQAPLLCRANGRGAI